ncbi:hypothetical protein FRC02_009876 [Tulasnella sp. 418]|nr:hypothetical protein FRC02_009876 [Tulasnella sp. 418]
MSPTPSNVAGGILRISTSIAPALFSNELEYLYTGSGLSDAFEFLFDSEKRPEGEEDDESRVDKLRKDLVFMWRSRLYSDIRISLADDSPATRERDSTLAEDAQPIAVFSSHRFILASRSQYFRNLLLSPMLSQPPPGSAELPITVSLPSPPFTPPSLHFILGYIYTGTMYFSHRTFDLTTAFHIIRGATYLNMNALYSEMEARIVEEMMHGLFHAYLPFEQYELITGGRWGVGGCKCKQCQRRAPRILDFAMNPDVNNNILLRGAQRALSGMFGEGWCSAEFAKLPFDTRRNLLKGVQKRATPINAIPLLFAAHGAYARLKGNSSGETWVDDVKDMVDVVVKKLNEVICTSCEEVFEQEEWVAILERDGVQFGDLEKVNWVMDAIRNGLNDKNAGLVYQTIVSAILLRPHPTSNETLLPTMSPVRTAVESARVDVLHWLRKHNRWQMVHNAGGFEGLDGWAIKEISDDLDIPVDTLLAPPRESPNTGRKSNGHPPPLPSRVRGDAESTMSSLHASVVNQSRHRGGMVVPNDPPKKDNASVHSISRSSMFSVSSRATSKAPSIQNMPSSPPPANSAMTRAAPPGRLKTIPSSRIQSSVVPSELDIDQQAEDERPVTPTTPVQQSTPVSPSTSGSPATIRSPPTRPPPPIPLESNDTTSTLPSTTKSLRVSNSSASLSPNTAASSSARPKSTAQSVTSVRSTTSTLRKTSGGSTGPKGGLAPPPSNLTRSPSAVSSRSAVSTRSDSSKSNKSDNNKSTSSTPPPPPPPKSPRLSTATLETRRRTSSSASAKSGKSINTSRTTSTATAFVFHDNQGRILHPQPSVSGPKSLRPRRASATSATSSTSQKGGATTPKTTPKSQTRKLPTPPPIPPTPADLPKPRTPRSRQSSASGLTTPSGSVKRHASNASMRSTASAVGGERRKSTAPSVKESVAEDKAGQPYPPTFDLASVRSSTTSLALTESDFKGKHKSVGSSDRSSTPTVSDGASTVRGKDEQPELKRKKSNDTITESNGTRAGHATIRPQKRGPPSITPRPRKGITLNVGIPCIIASKRSRFRAFARYIGEVEGETGPWVGVEVPVGESWDERKLAGRNWNDGTLGGVRYFEIGANSNWDDGEQRAARRRRLDHLFSDRGAGMSGKKREGDVLALEKDRLKRIRSASPAISDAEATAETRGLFVRPQQVLYVVNAEH